MENYEDNTSSGKFINVIEHETKQKESLGTLYELSNNIHSHHLYAPYENKLNDIIQELKENNLLYDENLVKK